MILPRCNRCGVQVNKGKIIKSLLLEYKPINCKECKTEHEITLLSRGLVSFLIFAPMILVGFILLNYFHLNVLITFILMTSISILCTLFCNVFICILYTFICLADYSGWCNAVFEKYK